jgi:hypothetical protein
MEKKPIEESSSEYSPSDNGSTGSNDSGSKTFGSNTRNINNLNPSAIKSHKINVNGKKFELYFENTIIPNEIIEKAQTYSPLLIDHIGKGSKGVIATRKRTSGAKSRAKTVKSRSSLKLIKQIKMDLTEEDEEPIIYTWMLVAELKKRKYHYYLLSNKVKSRQEIGTTHANIEKRYAEQMGHPPYRIYLAGEFYITPTTITYNFISGTYMRDKIVTLQDKGKTEKEDLELYTKPIEDLFGEMLQKYFYKFSIVKGPRNTSYIPTNNPNITPKELAFLQDILGEKWDTHVKRSVGSVANYLGMQPIVKTKEQQDAVKERLEKILNNLKKTP